MKRTTFYSEHDHRPIITLISAVFILVVLGQMSIHGVLSRVGQLGDRLRIALDAGARQVLIPTANAPDFAAVPPELLDKLSVDFYSEPSNGMFKALAE